MTSRARRPFALLILSLACAGHAYGQGGSARVDPGPASADDIADAVSALEAADGYRSLAAAVARYERAIASDRMMDLIDARLQAAPLTDEQRTVLHLMRQLSEDCRQSGAQPAARLMAVRLVASSALAVDTPEQLAAVLEQFSPLEDEISPAVVRDALDGPGTSWPPALRPLMEQLARDWPREGAIAAARAIATAGAVGGTGGSLTGDARPAGRREDVPVVGHWRSTRVVFEQSRDEHLVLHADGRAETWTVTAFERSGVTAGRWTARGSSLDVAWSDGREWSQPFTFFEGQLVFPNVPNRRQFWERMD